MMLGQDGTLLQIPSTCIIVKKRRNCNRNVKTNKKIKNIELEWVNMTAILPAMQCDVLCFFQA